LALFATLDPAAWEQPTACPGWSVKDIGLHLLGDDLSYLARTRDGFSNPVFHDKDLQTWERLVETRNAANDSWVRATARLSPQLLIDLLAWTGNQFAEYMHTLDPLGVTW